MKVTAKDIAKAAGVSQSTVSVILSDNKKIAISPETRTRVMKVAEQMGYQRKKGSKKKEQRTIVGLLVPTLSNLYYPTLIQNVEAYAKTMGWTLVVQNTMRSPEQEEKCFQFLREIGGKGVLCLFSPKTTIPKDMPAVIVGEKLPGVEVDTISLNCFASGQLAAEHLLSLGHKDIAYLTTPMSNITDARRKRLEGIQFAMQKAGVLDRLIVMVDRNENENTETTYEYNCGARLTAKLLEQHPRCTAIIAVNDMTAWGCIEVLNSRDIKIPEQMAICGFDNLMIDRILSPQLTSVGQMAFHGCKIGLSALMQKINETEEDDMVYMEYTPKLYVRGSTVSEKSLKNNKE